MPKNTKKEQKKLLFIAPRTEVIRREKLVIFSTFPSPPSSPTDRQTERKTAIALFQTTPLRHLPPTRLLPKPYIKFSPNGRRTHRRPLFSSATRSSSCLLLSCDYFSPCLLLLPASSFHAATWLLSPFSHSVLCRYIFFFIFFLCFYFFRSFISSFLYSFFFCLCVHYTCFFTSPLFAFLLCIALSMVSPESLFLSFYSFRISDISVSVCL